MLRPRLRLSALACLAATAAALTTLRPLNRGSLGRGDSGARPLNRGSLIGRDQRSATPLARLHALAAAGWIAQVDDSGGQTYYVNSQTGEAQWEEPPPQ